MRALDLINALDPDERREVELRVNNNRRKSMQVLYKELCRHAEKKTLPDNEFLYHKIFGKKYTKDKDYLLRNELRLLSNLIYEYMVSTFFNREIKRNAGLFNFWLALCFYKRNLKDLFSEDIDELIASLENSPNSYETMHPSYRAALHSMKSLFMITHQPRLIENHEAQLAMVDKWRNEEQKQFLHRLRESEARRAFIRFILHQLNQTYNQLPENFITPPQTYVDFTLLEESDWFARYLRLKKETFETRGEARIKRLKEKLTIETEKESILGPSHISVAMGALAIDLINAQRFAEADDYLHRALVHDEKLKLPYNSANIQNYIANQINLARYQKGMQVFERYRPQLQLIRGKNAIMLYGAFIYLLLNRADEALKCLPDFAALGPKEQVDYRFVYLASFIIRQEYELALTDVNNIKRMIKKNLGSNFTERLEIAALFTNYIKACRLKGNENKKALAAVKNTFSKNRERFNKLASLYFELKWLMEALGVVTTNK